MEEKQLLSALRREFNMPGLALLVYTFTMNVMVTVAVTLELVISLFRDLVTLGPEMALNLLLTDLEEIVATNAWGYLAACAVGYLILRLWKKKEFCRETIWQKGRPMTLSAFFGLLCVFSSGQMVFQLVATGLEWLLNFVGLSLLESIEMASGSAESVSMFLYMCLFAPVFEEILFRGLILRSLLPHGKRFAILVSAVLFGVFHGNLAQIPYAFAVGLVLGYVTVEYSIAWAMALHLFNNLILGDALTWVLSSLPGTLGDVAFMGIMILFSVAALIILVAKAEDVRVWRQAERIDRFTLRAFFTAPANVILILYMMANAISMVLLSAL